MPLTTQVEVIPEAGRESRACRYRYKSVAAGWPKELIVDIHVDGYEDWAERYPGECRWYPFTPSQTERAMVERGRAAGETLSAMCSVLP